MKKPRTSQAPTEQNTPALSKEPASTCDGGLIPSPSYNSQAPTGRKTIAQGKEPRTAALDSPHSSNSQAPTGRTIPAQGKESRDAALGPPPPQNPSPVGATQMPVSWVICRFADVANVISGKNQKDVESPSGTYPIYGSLDQIGRVAVWDGSVSNCGHQNHLIRARCKTQAHYAFVLMFLLSPHGRDVIVKQTASTSGLHTLSVSKVQRLPVPLCSLPEQQEIVRLLDEQFTVIAQNEQEIAAALKRSAALRQSILKKAFTGQLVPQDPTDEPASTLLARIQTERKGAERNMCSTTKKTTRKRATRKAKGK